MKVPITDEMREVALRESKKRHPHLMQDNFSGTTIEEKDSTGFFGEFACGWIFFGDWTHTIRDDYRKPDNGDFVLGQYVVDVKTESVPTNKLDEVVKRTIDDDIPYGRRLYCSRQARQLPKKDIILFGAVDRDNPDHWYGLGWVTARHILDNYKPTKETPWGGQYHTENFNVRTSELQPMDELVAKYSFELYDSNSKG